ncbi:hypothetical protein M9Y10_017437 [Tritrichomonas musculus]|uniref:Bromodomain containing protein n=1 Tax=Tritrichomonas musculus TaxID=1915356 RepID=A0ABR2HTT5_9EUKA
MDKREISYCIKILENLIDKPCAKPFVNPIDDKEEGCELYYKRIKSPIFLSTIQEKLLTNEYSSLDDIKHDISVIIKNTERFFGKNNYQSSMAHEMEKQFSRLIEKEEYNDQKVWITKIAELQERVENIIQNAPPIVKSQCKTISSVPALPPMRKDEIDNFIKITGQLTDKKDVHKMLQIILDLQPEIQITSKEMEIDISLLDNGTRWMIQDYAERRLKELGLE